LEEKMKKITILVLLVFVMTLVIGVIPASACWDCGPGVGTPGYWKNHPEAWPVDTIVITEGEGGVFYTKEQALEILNSPVKKDKSITMAKAFIAAYLNWKAGNCVECLKEDVFVEGISVFTEARLWLVKFPVGSGVDAKSEAWQYSHGEAIYWYLDDYNNGLLCAASRDIYD
jgi:hypothetical protein